MGEYPWYLQATAFGFFAMGNIGLNYFNSWAIKPPSESHPNSAGFNFCFFYTSWHMLCSAIAALILQLTCAKSPDGSLPSFGQLWEYKMVLFPIAVCTTLANGFNNMSLGLVALFVNQSIKACGPLPTWLLSLLVGKSYGWKIVVSIFLIVTGSILANAHGMGVGDTNILGVVYVLIALLAASTKPVIAMVAMESGGIGKDTGRAKLTPAQTLFWDGIISWIAMLTVWACVETERVGVLEWFSNPDKIGVGWGIIAAGSSMAFMFNIANYYFILYTSALTSTIGSNGVKIFLISITAITDGISDALSISGIALCTASIGLYGYFSFDAKKQAKAASDAPTEKTPLADAGKPLVSDEEKGEAEKEEKA